MYFVHAKTGSLELFHLVTNALGDTDLTTEVDSIVVVELVVDGVVIDPDCTSMSRVLEAAAEDILLEFVLHDTDRR